MMVHMCYGGRTMHLGGEIKYCSQINKDLGKQIKKKIVSSLITHLKGMLHTSKTYTML